MSMSTMSIRPVMSVTLPIATSVGPPSVHSHEYCCLRTAWISVRYHSRRGVLWVTDG